MAKWDADKLGRAMIRKEMSDEALSQRVDALLCRIQDLEAKLEKIEALIPEMYK